MKVYCIDDDIGAKEKGERWTSYESPCDRDRILHKRYLKYLEKGYKVRIEQDWWTTKKIVEVK